MGDLWIINANRGRKEDRGNLRVSADLMNGSVLVVVVLNFAVAYRPLREKSRNAVSGVLAACSLGDVQLRGSVVTLWLTHCVQRPFARYESAEVVVLGLSGDTAHLSRLLSQMLRLLDSYRQIMIFDAAWTRA